MPHLSLWYLTQDFAVKKVQQWVDANKTYWSYQESRKMIDQNEICGATKAIDVKSLYWSPEAI